MKESNRKYERNACFYLWLYRKDKDPQLQVVPISSELLLPISKKTYKVTLKNIKSYLSEILQRDDSITKVEIERATHVGSFEKQEQI